MGELKLFPMRYIHLQNNEDIATLVWAESSGRIVNVDGEAPRAHLHKDAKLVVTRMLSQGWNQIGTGEVIK